jgi:phospholipid/cholesterol/gamma-HCH transport system ATP-binding protein
VTHIALSIRGLRKRFGSKQVHEHIDFDLHQGEILALLGGSGSGKSVILRSIIGLETPDSGSILFEGRELVGLTEAKYYPIRTQIAYVFQNGALFDSLTVEENLSYPLEEHTTLSRSEITHRVNSMLKALDLDGSQKLLPGELSGGMQKRAGLARATILKPKITLFDEPTAGLDPVSTKRLVRNIKKLKEEGTTGIFVTHDMPVAFELADRIAILNKGRIHADDTVERIRASTDPIILRFTQPEME